MKLLIQANVAARPWDLFPAGVQLIIAKCCEDLWMIESLLGVFFASVVRLSYQVRSAFVEIACWLISTMPGRTLKPAVTAPAGNSVFRADRLASLALLPAIFAPMNARSPKAVMDFAVCAPCKMVAWSTSQALPQTACCPGTAIPCRRTAWLIGFAKEVIILDTTTWPCFIPHALRTAFSARTGITGRQNLREIPRHPLWN